LTKYAQTYPQKMWITKEVLNAVLTCYNPYGAMTTEEMSYNLINIMEEHR